MEEEPITDGEESYAIVIPPEIELHHEDPIAWWVENTIDDMARIIQEGEEEEISLEEMTLTVLAVAAIENSNRLNNFSPGTPSQVDWIQRLENMKRSEYGKED